jgi:hypothetical protein
MIEVRYLELKTCPARLRTGCIPSPLIEAYLPALVDPYDRRASRPVVAAANERAGQEAFPFEAHPRSRQILIPRRAVIAQEFEHRKGIDGLVEQGLQARLGPFNLRPRGIQNMIGKTINPRREDTAGARDAFMNGQALSVGKNQVESIVSGTNPLKAAQVVQGSALRLESVGDQASAAGYIRPPVLRRPVIRQCGEASGAGDSEPRAARDEIAPREDLRPVVPPMRGLGGAAVKLIAVRCDEARVLRMSTPDDENQAHPSFYARPGLSIDLRLAPHSSCKIRSNAARTPLSATDFERN